MAPELRLVKGDGGDFAPVQFSPDRAIPVRLAQISFVFTACAAVGAAMAQPGEIRLSFIGVGAVEFIILSLALLAALKRMGLRFTLSPQRLEVERGLVARRRESIDLFRIRDVVLDQGFIQRLRGLGSITLFSTDQVEPTLLIPSIGNAQQIYELLRDAASRARQQRVVQVDR